VSADTKIATDLLEEAIDALDRVGCQFEHCDGPTLDPVPMCTCYRCDIIARLRVVAGQPARRADEMTAGERIDDNIRRYMIEAVPR